MGFTTKSAKFHAIPRCVLSWAWCGLTLVEPQVGALGVHVLRAALRALAQRPAGAVVNSRGRA